MKIWKLAVLIPLTFPLLVGCTARSQLIGIQPLQTSLRSYSDVRVSVASRVAEDASQEIADLEERVIAEIQERGGFQSVELLNNLEPQPGTLVVDVAIQELKKVGGAKRFLAGAFAGRASMSSVVSLMDGPSRRNLGQYRVTGESGGSGYSGGTGDAVNKTATSIADIISENYDRGAGGQSARAMRSTTPSPASTGPAQSSPSRNTAPSPQAPTSSASSPASSPPPPRATPSPASPRTVSAPVVPAPPPETRQSASPSTTPPPASPSAPSLESRGSSATPPTSAQTTSQAPVVEEPRRTVAPPAAAPVTTRPTDRGSELMNNGNIAAAASTFREELRANPAIQFTIAVGIFCDTGNVARVYERSGYSADLFVLPAQLQGRSCYSVFWGRFGSQAAARDGLSSVPPGIRSADQVPIAISRLVGSIPRANRSRTAFDQ